MGKQRRDEDDRPPRPRHPDDAEAEPDTEGLDPDEEPRPRHPDDVDEDLAEDDLDDEDK